MGTWMIHSVPRAEIPAPKNRLARPHTPHTEAPGEVGSDTCTPTPEHRTGSGDVAVRGHPQSPLLQWRLVTPGGHQLEAG